MKQRLVQSGYFASSKVMKSLKKRKPVKENGADIVKDSNESTRTKRETHPTTSRRNDSLDS